MEINNIDELRSLQDQGLAKWVRSVEDGMMSLWEVKQPDGSIIEYVELCDNTIITREEDNSDAHYENGKTTAIFPYQINDLRKVDVDGDFIDQYLNTNSGYTVCWNDMEWTTPKNYKFIMELYQYFDSNKKEFTVDSELEKKYTPINLIGCVIDPDDEDDFLDSVW
jgi:hypothetical protein